MMKELKRKYSQGEADDLDGITIQFKTGGSIAGRAILSRLLRLNIEAKTKDLLEKQLKEMETILGEPA